MSSGHRSDRVVPGPWSRSDVLLLAGLAVCLALLLTVTSTLMYDRLDHRPDVVRTQLAILEGGLAVFGLDAVYLPTNQNRVLIPVLVSAVTAVGLLTAEQAYVVVRLASALALMSILTLVLAQLTHATPKAIAVGQLVLAGALIPTFNYGWEQPSDLPDASFMLAVAAAAIMHRSWLVGVLVAVAATNRESAAFGGVIWLCLYGWRSRVCWREVGLAVAFVSVALACTLGLRYALGGDRAIGPTTQTVAGFMPAIDAVLGALRRPSITSWLVLFAAMAGPSLLWLLANARRVDPVSRRLLVAAALMTLISIYFGLVGELRRHIPAVTLMVLAAAAVESGWRPERMRAPGAWAAA
jgi:hypothetical protein